MRSASARSRLVGVLFLLTSSLAMAQTASLSGTVKNNAGHPVPNATITLKNTSSGESTNVTTASDGTFSAANLAPGEYELSTKAADFNTETQNVTVAAGANPPLSLILTPTLSLQSLGFPSATTTANPAEQARLDRRSHMLKMHQELGLITTVPMAAALLTGNLAGGRKTSSAGRDLHVALGSTTAGLYFASAYYAIAAPKISGTETRGNIRLHKILAWIHGPGMVLTPILGAMAYNQKSNGERVHGIASAHVPVAVITAGAYGLAILVVSLHSGRRQVSTDGQP